MHTTNSLSEKIVINICDGRRLGYIANYEVDICSGKICAIFVSEQRSAFSFSRTHCIRIPWDKICKFGEDAILVDMPQLPKASDDCEKCEKKCDKKCEKKEKKFGGLFF